MSRVLNFKWRFFLVKIAILFLVTTANSSAAINFTIDNRQIPKVKILINSQASDNILAAFGQNLPNQDKNQAKSDLDSIVVRIKNNLHSTNLFSILQSGQIAQVSVENNLSIEQIPDFPRYAAAGVGMLLVADGSFDQAGNLEIKIRLWDVLDERQLFGKFYSANSVSYKKVANLISDEIYKAATGEKMGFFDSKIIYVAESGPSKKRVKRIAMMDFDGENHRYLTNGRELVLTPVFSRKNNEILFVRFFGQKPQIYSLDIDNLLVRKIGGFRGTTFAPALNPQDENYLVFSVIEGGNSNIYRMNLYDNELIRLTNSSAIDTTPSYSFDGNYIAFSSDRTGSEQIYTMRADGGNLRRITSDSGSYSKPVWSPDGNFIAFTKIKANQFSIGVISPDGRNEKTIASSHIIEGAKWSPNGRYLIYSKKIGAYGKASVPRLFIMDMLTGFERELPTPKNEGATDPEWVRG
jgi:TolB protein